MLNYLCQLKQMGAFTKISGILLGTFTKMEKMNCRPAINSLIKHFVGDDMPIIKTKQIGHGADSKALVIGRYYHFPLNY